MKKIKNRLSILCKASSIDGDSNTFSLFSIVEEIHVNPETGILKDPSGKEKVIPFSFELFTVWERTDDVNINLSSRIKTTIICPNGEEKDYIELPFEFELGKKSMRLRIKTAGLPFTDYGIYTFKIFIEENSKLVLSNEIPIEIKIQKS